MSFPLLALYGEDTDVYALCYALTISEALRTRIENTNDPGIENC